MRTSKWAVMAAAAAFIVLGASCAKLKSRDEMNRGVQAYKNAKYATR